MNQFQSFENEAVDPTVELQSVRTPSLSKDILIAILVVLTLGLSAFVYYEHRQISELTLKVATQDQEQTADSDEKISLVTADNSQLEQNTTTSQPVIKTCRNTVLAIKIDYDATLWTCKSIEENPARLTLTEKNIVVNFSNGDRGGPCLNCEKTEKIISTPFAQLNRYSDNPETDMLIYFGSVATDGSTWITASRTEGVENIFNEDFTQVEIESIRQLLTPPIPE